ncbi:hypothetical protein [Aminobacter sp. Piv2-1]|uniref:hypothetical protein n=1 Tax=Aminobacter sp. Piv2-1 TaxID=3031122 RepID=UPI0030B59991
MNRFLAQLDRRLEARGEDIVLRKRTQAGSTGSFVDATVPAIVRALTVEQLIGLVNQQHFFLIISPTHINRAQWPGGRTPTATGSLIDPADPRIPTTSDQVILRGAVKAIERVAPIFDAGECIRIELSVLG